MATHLTAEQIDKAVRRLYQKSGYVVLSQVRNGTGFSRSPRTADMLAVSTWPSRGLFAEGIEIKCHWNDLTRELENPAKADEIGKFCRYWWVAVPQGLIRPEILLPEQWGIIEVDDRLSAKVSKKATAVPEAPMDGLFVCAVLRNFADTHIHRNDIHIEIQKACDEREERLKAHQSSRLRELESAVATLKEKSGIDLLDSSGHVLWEVGSIGEAVNIILDLKSAPRSAINDAVRAFALAGEALEKLNLTGDSVWGRALLEDVKRKQKRLG